VFSYLPAGAPPWPTTVPLNLRGATGQTTEAVSSDQAIKPRRSKRGILQITGVLLLIPLLGVISTLGILYGQGRFPANGGAKANTNQQSSSKSNSAAATPTATVAQQTNVLPTPTSFKKASNQDVNISLQYPADWIADAPQKSTQVTAIAIHPQQQLGIEFVVGRLTDSMTTQFQSADEVDAARLGALSNSQGINNLRALSTSTPQITVGGTQWAQRDAMFTDDGGNNIHITTIAVLHNKAYYNIVTFIPDAVYNEATQKYVQPMLDSVQFLS